ncbi:hypothetical protein VKT23_016573 [Stygiomarasmius scandens]|uniref:F-actin-capping protein subunit alpha n=1 Tax=Marasmiellus scandens TaxID=2682957 RepID=A0ABR1IWA2_9AGAR
MTTIISDELLSLFRSNPQTLVKISNILQAEKDVQSFYTAIPSTIPDNVAQVLRERIVFPGNDTITDAYPATKSSSINPEYDAGAASFMRRFWYGVRTSDPSSQSSATREEVHDLYIECSSSKIFMCCMHIDTAGDEASLTVRYRGEEGEAEITNFQMHEHNEDEYKNGGVKELIGKVIKDIGLEGQVEPMEMIDWLIREEFGKYRDGKFSLEEYGNDVSLRDVIAGLEYDD